MNEALRAHVTRVGFNLTLTKSHIGALVYLSEVGAHRWDFCAVDHPPSRTAAAQRHGHFVVGSIGLEARGLITHDGRDGVDPYPAITWDEDGVSHLYSKRWTITRAGRAVIDLLKESGLYEQFARDLIYRDPQKERAEA